MSSLGTTTLSSFGQMYCCLTREPHLACSMLKEIAEELLAAENSFTGMDTRPKEMVAVPIARALMVESVAGPDLGGEDPAQGLGQPGARSPLLMLEEYVRLAPRLRGEPDGPLLQVGLLVVL